MILLIFIFEVKTMKPVVTRPNLAQGAKLIDHLIPNLDIDAISTFFAEYEAFFSSNTCAPFLGQIFECILLQLTQQPEAVEQINEIINIIAKTSGVELIEDGSLFCAQRMGIFPVGYALRNGFEETAFLLFQAGFQIEHSYAPGWNALEQAKENGQEGFISAVKFAQCPIKPVHLGSLGFFSQGASASSVTVTQQGPDNNNDINDPDAQPENKSAKDAKHQAMP